MGIQQTRPPRNIQLDFFRGIALMIIFVNHMPLNDWFFYTPSRFGFSDAAETFVFISGFAAALAYGPSFERAGLGLGTIRVLHRCGQIYAGHLASFFLLAAICVFGNQSMPAQDYIERLNIHYFFDYTPQALAGLFSLSYVPHFFDILPMYLAMMLWLPLVWLLSRLHIALAIAFPVLVYCGTWLFGWELVADPVTGQPWYFNPFAWQLMFFTGFALGAQWLPMPKTTSRLLGLCALLVVAAIPLSYQPGYSQVRLLDEARQHLEPWLDKSHLGILRWVYFLALACLMNRLFSWKPHWLQWALPRGIALLGRQALPMFIVCAGLSYLGGMALDWTGRDVGSTALVNLAGLGLLLMVAQAWAWLGTQPWKNAAGCLVPALARLGVGSHGIPAMLPALVLLSALPWLLMQNSARPSLESLARQSESLPTLQETAELSDAALQALSGEPSEWRALLWAHYTAAGCEWLDGAAVPPPPQESDQTAF